MKNVLPIAALVSLFWCTVAGAGTLDDVTARGYVKCGVNAGHEGFASPDTYGVWHGFDVDFCRAVAAAVLGDPERVMFISANRGVGVDSLATGSADLISRVLQGLSTSGGPGARDVGVLLHDSYGFMVPDASDVTGANGKSEARGRQASLAALDRRTVCTTQVNGASEIIVPALSVRAPGAKVHVYPNLSEPLRRYANGECEVLAALRTDLAGLRARLKQPGRHRLLPVELGKAPTGPRVRGDDDAWAKVVQWILFALIEAEELGLTSDNVDKQRRESESGRVRELLGARADTGAMLGLSQDWAYRIVSQVGSYGEIYARNLGPGTPLSLPRTRSRLWNEGGMLFAPPAAAR